MTEDNFPRVSSSESTDSSSTKQRKKRKWDQPAESLCSSGVAAPGLLPLPNLGSLPGVALPGVATIPSASFSNSLTASVATILPVIQLPLQQHATAIAQKINQPKIQDELIAREIVINDADSTVRYKLTKRQTQEEIQKCTGAIVITRGKYRPPNAPADGEKPLYLHISAAAHLETTAERIKAVDHAAAMVEEMLKHGSFSNTMNVNPSLSACVFLGFEADPSLNIAARIRGPNDQYVNHIMNETGATVLLRGRGSGYCDSVQDDAFTLFVEGQQPLHLLLSSSNAKSLERAKLLAENLLDTISAEFGASRVSSSKVYGAVPPPPQLLAGVQSSLDESNPSVPRSASLTASAARSIPSTVSSISIPGASSIASQGPVPHAGCSNPASGLSHAITGGYSQSSLTGGTSYNGYDGIYPQATPLQQVALALRQSTSPVTTLVAPAVTTASTASYTSTCSSSEKDKRSSQKRKFQELPAVVKSLANTNQGSELAEPCEQTSDIHGKDIKRLVQTSANGIIPTSPRTMPPPTMLPPPPKFTTSRPGIYGGNSIKNGLKSESVPDTLIKLMEYGDEDEDDDLGEPNEDSIKRCSSTLVAPKPFWAV
ncbi:protein RIK-like isoform X1 [Coffea arabica]|uniref:Protein RIK-like isoform X1 n=1 Tax=Coffea arabica TaxID=13443 RepID=A0ABM4V0Z0_COFAR